MALYAAGLLVAVTALLVAGAAAGSTARRTTAELGSHATAGPTALRLRALLVGSEAALAGVLLVAVGLLWRSESALLRVDPGLRLPGLSVARVSLPAARYRTPAALRAFHDGLRDRLGEVDGEARLALVNVLPLSGVNSRTDFDILDRPAPSRTAQPGAQTRWVNPGYFETAGIRVREGRGFGPEDDAAHPRVVVVDEALARAFWPGTSPLGAMLHVSFTAEPAADYRVVGVVANVKHESLDERPAGTLYAPLYQVPGPVVPNLASGLSVLIRSERLASGLGRRLADLIHAVDPEIPISSVQPGEALLEGVLSARRSGVRLLELFAAAALALCLSGLYAVLAYAQVQRRRELAIRSALGATPATQAGSVLGTGLRWVGSGAVLGVATGALIAHAFTGLLFGVHAVDAPTLASVLGVLLLTALLASAHPAFRAARVSPHPRLPPSSQRTAAGFPGRLVDRRTKTALPSPGGPPCDASLRSWSCPPFSPARTPRRLRRRPRPAHPPRPRRPLPQRSRPFRRRSRPTLPGPPRPAPPTPRPAAGPRSTRARSVYSPRPRATRTSPSPRSRRPTLSAAVDAAWKLYRPDMKRPLKLVTPRPGREGWEERQVFDYETSPNERAVAQAIAYRKGNAWTVVMLDGTEPTFEKRLAPTGLVIGSLRPGRLRPRVLRWPEGAPARRGTRRDPQGVRPLGDGPARGAGGGPGVHRRREGRLGGRPRRPGAREATEGRCPHPVHRGLQHQGDDHPARLAARRPAPDPLGRAGGPGLSRFKLADPEITRRS